jgi:hypothetical protein
LIGIGFAGHMPGGVFTKYVGETDRSRSVSGLRGVRELRFLKGSNEVETAIQVRERRDPDERRVRLLT